MTCKLLHQQYRVQGKLGDALYGAVLLCQDTLNSNNNNNSNNDNKLVAIKQVSLQHARRALLLNGHMDNPWDELRIMTRVMRLGGHDNILRIRHEFVEKGTWYVVMDFCDGGDVLDLLHQSPDHRFPEHVAMTLFAQIGQGVHFLHTNGIAHRDLSLENVLVQNNTCKLCDFGLSTESDRMCSGKVGKAYYMAPEVVAEEEAYDPAAADMWSLGVMLFIMLTGSPLAPSASVDERGFQALKKFGLRTILRVWGMDTVMSSGTLELLEGLLQVDPATRFTIQDVLRHPVVRNLL